MQTNDDWTSREASEHERREAEENGEEVDEIVQELPIVLSQTLAQTLYLMQSPLRSEAQPASRRTKPQAKRKEERRANDQVCVCATRASI